MPRSPARPAGPSLARPPPLAQPAAPVDPRGGDLLPRSGWPAPDRAVAADQPDPARRGAGRRAGGRLDLVERRDAPAAPERPARPAYAFSGEPLFVDYTLENDRRHSAALALILSDEMSPVDRSISGGTGLYPRGFFPRVAGRARAQVRWEGVAPRRGRYRFRSFDLVTRSPFGLLERRVSGGEPTTITIYPTVGHLTRRWQHIQREASETRRGSRHDRSIQQQEYHGLRDYRPGDSPRWIHWRTSARVGQLMVKEFEQQHEQDLAILLDPWLPRHQGHARAARGGRGGDPVRRDGLPRHLPPHRAAAPPGLDRRRARPPPGARVGQAPPRAARTARDRPALSRRTLAGLLDVIPPSTLRESILIVVSTRPLNLQRRGREVDAAARLGDPRPALAGDPARRGEGRPGRPVPVGGRPDRAGRPRRRAALGRIRRPAPGSERTSP